MDHFYDADSQRVDGQVVSPGGTLPPEKTAHLIHLYLWVRGRGDGINIRLKKKL